MERHNKRSGEYPSLTYQKNSQGSGSKHHGHSQRISLGSFNDNLVQGEKRHIKRFNRDAEEDDWEDAEHNDRDTRQRNRRSHHQVDDHYEEDFNQLSLEDDSDENHGRQGRRHYPPTKANQTRRHADHRHDRLVPREDEDDYSDDDADHRTHDEERARHKSPASPLAPPRRRRGSNKGEDKPLRMPPTSSPRLLRSRSPNSISPRSPTTSPRTPSSPDHHRGSGKDHYAYYEEDVQLNLRPKSNSPRDKTQSIPSLGSISPRNHQTPPKRSPRDKHKGDDFDWNDLITSSSRLPRSAPDKDDYMESERHKTSPREGQGGESGRWRQGRERERRRTTPHSPPRSPLSSSGGSSSRSPWESPRSQNGLKSSWSENDSLSSSGERSSRDGPRPTHVPPVPARRNKGASMGEKLEPIDYR